MSGRFIGVANVQVTVTGQVPVHYEIIQQLPGEGWSAELKCLSKGMDGLDQRNQESRSQVYKVVK